VRSPRPAVVGGFVLGGLALIVAAILFFGSGRLFVHTTRAVVFFEGSVGGLVPGAPVTFRGVRVGSVASVTLLLDSRDLRAEIPVYLRLDPEQVTLVGGPQKHPTGEAPLHRLIEAGLRAKLISQSLVTGQMLVELDINPDAPARYVRAGEADVPEIPAIPSDLEELRQKLTQAPIVQTVVQAQRTLAAFEKLANRLDTQLDPLASSAEHALSSATRTMDDAGAAIQQVRKDVAATLEVAQAFLHDGRRQLDARGGELSQTLLSAEQALRSANALLGSANGLVASRSQARSDLEATLRDIAASASALRDFAQTIERNPSTILRGRSGP